MRRKVIGLSECIKRSSTVFSTQRGPLYKLLASHVAVEQDALQSMSRILRITILNKCNVSSLYLQTKSPKCLSLDRNMYQNIDEVSTKHYVVGVEVLRTILRISLLRQASRIGRSSSVHVPSVCYMTGCPCKPLSSLGRTAAMGRHLPILSRS